MESCKVALTFECMNDLTVQMKPLYQSVLFHGINVLKENFKKC